jgi:lipoyl(octanoyl) transferase
MWRLISDGAGAASWNMAVDEAILEACIQGEAPATMRIYSWKPAGISLGHFQKPERALFVDTCRAEGIEAARRPTGGRAILHDNEITFSIVAPLSDLGTQGVMDSYRYLGAGIVTALRLLGVPAKLVDRAHQSPHATASVQDKGSPAACFTVKSRCDLMVAGHKIVGSAQVHRHQVVLQQNSLPFVVDTNRWKEVFRGMEGVGDEAIGLWQAAGRDIPFGDVAAALREGFERALKLEFREGALSKTEAARATELVAACRML